MKKALVLGLAVVLGLGVASFAQGVLSGSWDSTITIDPQLSLFTGFDSTIAIEYAVSGWTFSSETIVDLHGWVGQQFGFDGSLGAFTMGGTVDFTPMPAAFNYALVTGGVSIAGVEFGATWLLENLPEAYLTIVLPPYWTMIPLMPATGDVGLELTASGTAGAVTIDVTVGFGDISVVPYAVDISADGTEDYDHVGDGVCDLDWNSIAIDVTFPFCCAEVTGSLAFDCDGFVSACFEVDNILVPTLPWFDLDVKVCFSRVDPLVQTGSYTYDKSFLVRPGFTLGTLACFDIYAYLDVSTWSGTLTLDYISIQGFGLECDIGGVTFTGLTWFGPKAPKGILAGTNYFEAYQIKTTDDGCCGPFDFDLTFFFETGGLALFDIGEVVANVSYELGANFIFTTGLTVDMGTTGVGFSEWTIGFEVTW